MPGSIAGAAVPARGPPDFYCRRRSRTPGPSPLVNSTPASSSVRRTFSRVPICARGSAGGAMRFYLSFRWLSASLTRISQTWE